jgi:hypothetical protein
MRACTYSERMGSSLNRIYRNCPVGQQGEDGDTRINFLRSIGIHGHPFGNHAVSPAIHVLIY